jgi:4-aminobutyrate aminotransferase-like enzyme
MFTCTGSEANELALRIARECSGGQGVIGTAHAYHGNTAAVIQLGSIFTPLAKRWPVRAHGAGDGPVSGSRRPLRRRSGHSLCRW